MPAHVLLSGAARADRVLGTGDGLGLNDQVTMRSGSSTHRTALVLVYAAIAIPFAVFQLRGAVLASPMALEEPAIVDGTTHRDPSARARKIRGASAQLIGAKGISTSFRCANPPGYA